MIPLPIGLSTNFHNKTILITGCNGFLGKSLVHQLCAILDSAYNAGESTNHSIICIDNGITSCIQSLPDKPYITYFSNNAITFDYFSIKHVDIIFHLAGLASPAQYKKYPLETIDVAVSLTRTLLQRSLEWKATFVFFSSSEIYGNPNPQYIPTPEDYNGYVSCRGPRSCYDESKRMGETLCHVYHKYYDVKTITIRPFNIYGPGMSKHDYRMIPNLMRALVEGSTLQIYGDGLQTRTYCYIDDAINGILRACVLGQPGNVYNIGRSNPELSVKDLLFLTESLIDKPINYEYVEYPDSYPADEPLRRCPDISKAAHHLGYEASVPIEKGLQYTYEWASVEYLP